MIDGKNTEIAALRKQVEDQNRQIQKLSFALKKNDVEGDQFMEPQTFLTRHLAKWSPRVDERTRILSYEELDWMDTDMLLALVLGVPVFGIEATNHMRLLISKDGLNRQEDVQAMQALNQIPKGHYSGLEEASTAIELQRQSR